MVVIAAKQGSNMLLFQRACKWGQSWDYKTQNDAFALACLKIERGVTLKVILGQNSNRCHDQIEPQRGYLGGSIFRVLVRVTVTEKQGSRVLSRIYLLGEKSRAAEGDELPRGSGAFPSPPPNFEMNTRWDAIWCILRHNFEKFYSVCTDFVTSGWFFRYGYCNDNNIFLGGGGSSYPSNTLDRTLGSGFALQTARTFARSKYPGKKGDPISSRGRKQCVHNK